MSRIVVEISPQGESQLTFNWCFMAIISTEPANERKQMNEDANSSCALPHHTDNWATIQWRKVIQSVSRLQRRIAKAVKEKHWGKAKALMYLLSKSFYAKLLAVLRVTTNKGGKTPGVDNLVWQWPDQKLQAAKSLVVRGYQPKPLRRVYILKKNGKKRPLSIPKLLSYYFFTVYCRNVFAVTNIQIDSISNLR